MEPTQKAALAILANIEATYKPVHDYVAADPQKFRHLDLQFYERTARLLSAKGFRHLADLEDRTITNAPGTVLMPVLIRALVSKDGTIMSALYHPRIGKLVLRILLWVMRTLPKPVVDMETECSDGTFVVTSNAASAAAIDLPALISARYLAAGTSVHEVHQEHVARLRAHLAERPGVTPLVVGTHQEMLASQHRMNAIKAAHRGEVGGITREELDRLAKFGKGLVPAVHEEIRNEQLRRAG
ncbi:MAG: hypothetical protein IT355_18680 [Gemmatimonadaceae bacterium]|nr:hypothetical protein [Gemmatimonadaceae bacterium]